MNHTCIAFPAEAGTHLPTPEGWKAELAFHAAFHLQPEPRAWENRDSLVMSLLAVLLIKLCGNLQLL